MKSQRSSAGSPIPRVRKRISVGHGNQMMMMGIPTDDDPSGRRWDPDDYYYNSKTAKATAGTKVRNFFLSIAVVSFPIGIFMIPLLLRASAYPRVVVSLSTTPERLPYIRPTLESLLYRQSQVPDVIYLVLPELQQQQQQQKQQLQKQLPPLPDFLQAMITTTNLEILQPTSDFGPVANVLHVLDKEKERQKQQEQSGSTIRTDTNSNTNTNTETSNKPPSTKTLQATTRIIYLSDEFRYHPNVVQKLVDASLEADDGDVIAFSGGRLRNKFRQIKQQQQHSSNHNDNTNTINNNKYDKHPNLFMSTQKIQKQQSSESEESLWRKVDIVQGFTAVCIPVTMNTQGLLNSKFFLQDSSLSAQQQQQRRRRIIANAGDILLSAAMEMQNMTRWVVPSGSGSSSSSSSSSGALLDQYTTRHTNNRSTTTSSTTMTMDVQNNINSKDYMEAVHSVQQEFHIWQDYTFLDLQQLTKEQLDAMDCEATYEQDCSNGEKEAEGEQQRQQQQMCWPNPDKCPEARGILAALN